MMGRNCWKRALLIAALALTTALAPGCGSSGSDGGMGGSGPRLGNSFPNSGSEGPGTGIPVPFSPGTNLVSLNLSPSTLNLYRGLDQPLTIEGVNGNGSTIPITVGPGVSITSRPPGLLNVSSTGVITPVARGNGTVDISVTTPDGEVTQSFPFSVRRRMFVTHWGDDTLRVLDAETYAPVQTLNLGGHPLASVVHPATDKLWVGVGDGQGIQVFDLGNLDLSPTEIPNTLTGYGFSRGLFNPLNNTMVWVHQQLAGIGGSLQGYDVTTLSPISGSPETVVSPRSLATDGTGTLLLTLTLDFLADTGLQVHDSSTLAASDFISTWQTPLDYGFPTDLVYDQINQCAYVATYDAVNIPYPSKIITVDMSIPRNISASTPLPTPRTGAMAMSGGRVFVAHFNSPYVSVLETTSVSSPLTFVRTLTSGLNPAKISIDPVLNRLVVSVESTDSLAVFDLTTLEPIPGSPFSTGGDNPAACVYEP